MPIPEHVYSCLRTHKVILMLILIFMPMLILVMNLLQSMNRLNPYIFNVNFKSGLLEIGQEINKCNITIIHDKPK